MSIGALLQNDDVVHLLLAAMEVRIICALATTTTAWLEATMSARDHALLCRLQQKCLTKSTSLTTLRVPTGLTSIRDGAFAGCSSLAAITLPDSLTSIGAGAFRGCSSLAAITLPDSLTIMRLCLCRLLQ